MALELIHTSAVAGLHGHASGFCTVAMTTGTPSSLEQRLAALGGYRPLGGGATSPASFSHLRVDVGGRRWHVLSALRPAPPDQSGRANKLVHHLALSADELVDAGPAWLLRQPGVVIDHFEGPPRWIPQPRPLPTGDLVAPRRSAAWERATGDAGWAGALVNQFLLDPARVSCIVHGPEIDALELVDEAIALLPPALRWRVTFATHFQQPIAGVHCAWRFCVVGTQAAFEASRRATGLFLDVNETRRTQARAKQGRYTDLARSGHAPWWSREAESDALDAMSRAEDPSMRAGELRASGGRGQSFEFGNDASESGVEGTDLDQPSNARQPWPLRDGGAHRDGVRVGRVVRWTALLLIVAALSALATIASERSWWRTGAQSVEERDRAARVEEERDRLRSEASALRAALEAAQTRLVDGSARERELGSERDGLKRALDSAEDRLRKYEGAPSPAPSAPGALPSAPIEPASAAPRSPAPTSAPSPSSFAPSTPSPAPPRTPAAAPSPPPPGTAASATPDGLVIFPSEALTRRFSRLGVIDGDRRPLLLLASTEPAFASLRIEFPPTFSAVSTSADATGRAVSLWVTPGANESGTRRVAAIMECDGRDLLFRWEASLNPKKHESLFAALDEALPFLTVVATLEDGSTRRLAPAPIVREVSVGKGAATATAIGARSPTLRLAPNLIDGWTLDSARSTANALVLVHRAGSLHAALDGKIGRITVAFLSPLHDELDAAQRELKKLEADRPNIPPDERGFHESAIRDASDRVDALTNRIAREAPHPPTTLPTISIEDEELARVVLIIRPTLTPPARGAPSP